MPFYQELMRTLLAGVGYTLLVTLLCAATALLIGLGIAVARKLGGRWVDRPLAFIVYVARGVPMLVLLFLVFFGLPGIGIDVAPIPAMMLSLGLISGAYLAEIFRGALASVRREEVLFATASGMTRLQILRYIELPQMFRFAVPGMINELTTVLKYSPFAYTVGVPEITKQAMALVATTLRGIEVYAVIGLMYFAIYQLLLIGVRAIERRFQVPGFASESLTGKHRD